MFPYLVTISIDDLKPVTELNEKRD